MHCHIPVSLSLQQLFYLSTLTQILFLKKKQPLIKLIHIEIKKDYIAPLPHQLLETKLLCRSKSSVYKSGHSFFEQPNHFTIYLPQTSKQMVERVYKLMGRYNF